MSFFQRVEQPPADVNAKKDSEEKAVHIDINIPDILKKKLEDDCFYVNKRKKVQPYHQKNVKSEYKRVLQIYFCCGSWCWFPATPTSCTSWSRTSNTSPSTRRSWPTRGTGGSRTPTRTARRSQSLRRRGKSTHTHQEWNTIQYNILYNIYSVCLCLYICVWMDRLIDIHTHQEIWSIKL